ncbi:hypothetical protein [Anaerotalea alkaliphila]|uniref:Uncharacterized protein n=1 Tax=Anaerotalea alkaliphila TaxID=2662126 RepID=A0A7X5HUN1_9FIRM|nr:hypothetical protein [Anaerotalea alkaliphila]NDL66967.1 hypothetical protein [Anaerotalea alkaliphila]
MAGSGRYILAHPRLPLAGPRLLLDRGKKGKGPKGSLRWLGFRRKLRLLKEKGESLTFLLQVDIIPIEMVLFFPEEGRCEGFFDTPLGHIPFTGRRRDKRKSRERRRGHGA